MGSILGNVIGPYQDYKVSLDMVLLINLPTHISVTCVLNFQIRKFCRKRKAPKDRSNKAPKQQKLTSSTHSELEREDMSTNTEQDEEVNETSQSEQQETVAISTSTSAEAQTQTSSSLEKTILNLKLQLKQANIEVAILKNEVELLKLKLPQNERDAKSKDRTPDANNEPCDHLNNGQSGVESKKGEVDAQDKNGEADSPVVNDKSNARMKDSPSKLPTNKAKKGVFTFENIKDSDKQFKFYTGISYDQFEAIFEFLGPAANKLSYWNRDNKNAEKTPTKKPGPDRKLSPRNELLLTLMRLRLCLLYEDLAYRFGIAASHVSTIVITSIQFLYVQYKSIQHLFCPSRSSLGAIPKCYRKYKNIRFIIDCTEIFTQNSSDFAKQGNSFSHYKHHTTHKILVAILPNGMIGFVSDAFEGSMSDVQITKESGFLDLVEPHDLVMADRGFTIQNMLQKKRAHLNIPPFLMGRSVFTVEEEARTKVIAKCRIHVERVIERLKKFRIIKNVMPSNEAGIVSQIVFVLSVLVNHQQPVVR